MTVPEFSESSYAFAVTRDLVGGAFGNVVAAPEFPTLRQEGASGGGYDIKIPFQAVAVFFQFKVPQVLRRNSKLRPPQFPLPYYRIPLRTKHPNQHQLLLDLESRSELVFYAAPIFHQGQELSRHYQSDAVASHSAFFLPSDVGPLDENDHHIAYARTSSVGWFRSDPSRIERKISAEDAVEMIRNAVNDAPKRTPEKFIGMLADTVMSIVNRQSRYEGEPFDGLAQDDAKTNLYTQVEVIPDEPFERISRSERFGQIAEAARTRLGCEVIVFGNKVSDT